MAENDIVITILSPAPSAGLCLSIVDWTQVDAIKQNKPLIIVGTPGRLAELSRAGSLLSHSCPMLVLDEARPLYLFAFSSTCSNYSGSLPALPHFLRSCLLVGLYNACTSGRHTAFTCPLPVMQRQTPRLLKHLQIFSKALS